MLETAFVAARDRARLTEIAAILFRFGVDGLVKQLGLHKLIPHGKKRIEQDKEQYSLPERLRLALEALGPTYIKLGQILATRHDLLSPQWTTELSKLHNHVTPLDWEVIHEQLCEDLGAQPEQVFAHFDRQPLASASIAQVYKATLKGGQPVIVKVQRPQLQQTIDADLRLLSHLAQLLQDNSAQWARFKPVEIVEYLSRSMRLELDFNNEGRNCERIAAQFADDPHIVIPGIYWQWSSERLLVQDFIQGWEPESSGYLRAQGLDPDLVARRGAQAMLKMILDEGEYHADPHPGNLLAMSGNRIGFIDFGLVGRLSTKRKNQLLVLLRAIQTGQTEGVTAMLLEWSASFDADPVEISLAVERFLAEHRLPPLRISGILTDFMSLSRHLKIALPPDLSLLFKTFITADGVLKAISHDIDLIALAEPTVRAQLKEYYSPEAMGKRALYVTSELYELAGEAPGFVRLLMHRIRHGRIGVDLNLHHIEQLNDSLERAAARLCVALVTAAFALGLAPHLMDLGPRLWGIPIFVWLGLAATVSGSALLLFWLFKR